MKISIIIPVYNATKTLKECLNSIFSCDYKDFEVIVVSDGSQDDSVDIARRYACQVVSLLHNYGPAFARNKGGQVATGDTLLFIDADVKIKKNALTLINTIFSRNSDINVVQGVYSHKVAYKNFTTQYQQSFYCYYTFGLCDKYVSTLMTHCFAIRRKTFINSGGFNIKINNATAEDEEFGYNLTAKGNKIILLKELEVEHLVDYSFKKFLKRNFKMYSDTMRSYLRNKFYVKKIEQKNYLRVILGIFLLMLIILNFIVIFVYPVQPIIVLFLILNAFFIFLHFPFWKFIKKTKGLKMAFGSSLITYVDTFIMIIANIYGVLSFLLGRKY